MHFGRLLSAESSAPAGTTLTTRPARTWAGTTRAARPAELRTRQRGIQAFAQFLFVERAAFVAVPFGEPLCETALELVAGERAVFVGVGGAEKARRDEAPRPAAAAAVRRAKAGRWRKEIPEVFGEFFLVDFACFARVELVKPRVGQAGELFAR